MTQSAPPRRRGTILKWSLLIAMLGYLVWISFWARGEASRHKCVGIDVRIANSTSADSITRRGVLDELKRYPKPIVGAQINTVNTADIHAFLSSFSNFESVECVLTPGGVLRVNIVPMIPEIRVFSPDGSSYYVNKDGKRIASNAEFYIDVPIVRGDFNTGFPASSVLPLVRFIQNDPQLKNLVAMIEARDAHNLILVPRIQGHVINFGDINRLEEKRDMLFEMYRRVMPYKGWQEYDTISVKFKGQIVASRRDKSPARHSEEFLEDVDLEEATLPEQPHEEAVLATRPEAKMSKSAQNQPDTPNPATE